MTAVFPAGGCMKYRYDILHVGVGHKLDWRVLVESTRVIMSAFTM